MRGGTDGTEFLFLSAMPVKKIIIGSVVNKKVNQSASYLYLSLFNRKFKSFLMDPTRRICTIINKTGLDKFQDYLSWLLLITNVQNLKVVLSNRIEIWNTYKKYLFTSR